MITRRHWPSALQLLLLAAMLCICPGFPAPAPLPAEGAGGEGTLLLQSDFSRGWVPGLHFTALRSAHAAPTAPWAAGTVGIVTSPRAASPHLAPCTDASGSSSGGMLVARVQREAPGVLLAWGAQLPVLPGRTYALRARLATLTPGAAPAALVAELCPYPGCTPLAVWLAARGGRAGQRAQQPALRVGHCARHLDCTHGRAHCPAAPAQRGGRRFCAG